jgi:hypothetical protein
MESLGAVVEAFRLATEAFCGYVPADVRREVLRKWVAALEGEATLEGAAEPEGPVGMTEAPERDVGTGSAEAPVPSVTRQEPGEGPAVGPGGGAPAEGAEPVAAAASIPTPLSPFLQKGGDVGTAPGPAAQTALGPVAFEGPAVGSEVAGGTDEVPVVRAEAPGSAPESSVAGAQVAAAEQPAGAASVDGARVVSPGDAILAAIDRQAPGPQADVRADLGCWPLIDTPPEVAGLLEGLDGEAGFALADSVEGVVRRVRQREAHEPWF